MRPCLQLEPPARSQQQALSAPVHACSSVPLLLSYILKMHLPASGNKQCQHRGVDHAHAPTQQPEQHEAGRGLCWLVYLFLPGSLDKYYLLHDFIGPSEVNLHKFFTLMAGVQRAHGAALLAAMNCLQFLVTYILHKQLAKHFSSNFSHVNDISWQALRGRTWHGTAGRCGRRWTWRWRTSGSRGARAGWPARHPRGRPTTRA